MKYTSFTKFIHLKCFRHSGFRNCPKSQSTLGGFRKILPEKLATTPKNPNYEKPTQI